MAIYYQIIPGNPSGLPSQDTPAWREGRSSVLWQLAADRLYSERKPGPNCKNGSGKAGLCLGRVGAPTTDCSTPKRHGQGAWLFAAIHLSLKCTELKTISIFWSTDVH